MKTNHCNIDDDSNYIESGFSWSGTLHAGLSVGDVMSAGSLVRLFYVPVVLAHTTGLASTETFDGWLE